MAGTSTPPPGNLPEHPAEGPAERAGSHAPPDERQVVTWDDLESAADANATQGSGTNPPSPRSSPSRAGTGNGESPDRVSLADIAAAEGAFPSDAQPSLRVIGWNAFRLLLGFIGVSLALLTIYAWFTYPRLGDFTKLAAPPSPSASPRTLTSPSSAPPAPTPSATGNTGPANGSGSGSAAPAVSTSSASPATPTTTDAVTMWSTARKDWEGQLRDLGGLFIITPLVPLLGTILGYIFGRQESQGSGATGSGA